MEATLTARAEQFFILREDTKPDEKLYRCTICKKGVSGKQKSNLSVHIKTCHIEIYNTKVKLPGKNSVIAIREKRLVLLQNCVRKVTIDQEPFTSILKSSFHNIIASKLKKFALANVPLDLRDKNLIVVKNHIHKTTTKICIKIKDQLKGRLFSLLVDGAFKHNRSVLGISVQYILNGSLKIRMLGLKELTQSHTGDYMGSVVRECVEEYDCNISQAIGVTTDNAKNLSKMVRGFNEKIAEERLDERLHALNPNEDLPHNYSLDCNDVPLDIQIDELLKGIQEIEASEINEILNNSSDDEEDDMIEIDPRDIRSSALFVNHVNCGAHTLQLVIGDALKDLSQEHKNIIMMCREFAKFIRRPTSSTKLKNLGIKWKYPKLDCSTRWGSTLHMVNSINTENNYT